jgi:hypothetical protein
VENQKERDMQGIIIFLCILKCALQDVVVAAESSAAHR